MVIVEVSVVPLGTSSPSLSSFVATAVAVLKKRRVKYELHAMGTNFEVKTLSDAFDIIREMHETVLSTHSQIKRLLTTIKIDDRRDIHTSMTRKKTSVVRMLKTHTNTR